MSETRHPGDRGWESLIERRIREAREEGLFDNLPGRGRPVDLEENPFEDPDWRLPHRLLKAHGFAPAWIELDGWIRAERMACRRMLAEASAWATQLARSVDQGRISPREAKGLWEKDRQRLEREFAERVGKLNQAIERFNLTVPVPRLQRAKMDVTAELKKLPEAIGDLMAP